MKTELAKTIGSEARKARKALQLTQADAADRVGVSYEFYARIERGKSLPSIGTFVRISSALGVSADAMLGTRLPWESAAINPSWTPEPPDDSPELRRLIRRLRKAPSSTLRLMTMVAKKLRSCDCSDSDESEPVVREETNNAD